MPDPYPRGGAKAYQSAELTTISQRDLLVRLYQGAERFLAHARDAMHKGQPDVAHAQCQKAKAIFSELVATLNFEHGGPIAFQLKELYMYLIMKTVESNLRKDPVLIDQILPVVATLRQAWQQIPEAEANISAGRPPGDGSNFAVHA
jgi:flagellar protein FliS